MSLDRKNTILLAVNSVFAASVIGATVYELVWLGYLVIGFIWLMIIIYAFAVTSKNKSEVTKFAYISMWIFDISIFGLLGFFNWYLTAAAYAVSCILEGMATRLVSSEGERPK